MNRFPFSLSNHVNLSHLFWLRCCAIGGQLIAIVVASLFFGVHLPLAPMLIVIGLEVIFNALTWLRVAQARGETPYELFGQLIVDLGALSALLFLSGGDINPFISLYLPALAIGAAVLPWPLVLLLALFAVSCYALLSFDSVPLNIESPGNMFDYYRTGIWINFMISVALIVWFVARMSRALRAGDAALAQAERRMLRDERVVALGAQAASVAHEMGTPLSTIAMLLEELRSEARTANSRLAPYAEDLALLEQQLDVCKTALARLQSRANSPTLGRLADWYDGFVEQWRLRHPQIEFECTGAQPPADAIGDTAAIGQILTILLGNAARASPGSVTLELVCADDTIEFRVLDRGAGIAEALRAQLGKMPVASTQGGQGVGLYLAFATATLLSGSIDLTDAKGGGTCAILKLPASRAVV